MLSLLLLFSIVTFCFAIASVSAQGPACVLTYARTVGFRHDSIPTAVKALQEKASSINVTFDHTEDSAQFSDEILAGYDALLFLSTTGEVLDSNGKAAFQKYLNLGGNFVAVHSSSDTLRNDTFYKLELGELFTGHLRWYYVDTAIQYYKGNQYVRSCRKPSYIILFDGTTGHIRQPSIPVGWNYTKWSRKSHSKLYFSRPDCILLA